MKIVAPTYGEIALRNCMTMLGGNYLTMPQYYTQLFQTFKQLLDENDTVELNKMIAQIEDWLSDNFNRMTLQEAEIRMWNNMDLNSGFQVDGIIITQMEIYERLDKIKDWLRGLIAEYLPMIRFTQNLRTD